MRQEILVKTYKILKRLSDEPMDFITSYKILSLQKKLEKHFEFELNEENKYLREFHGKFSDDKLRIEFDKPENAKLFREKIIELNNIDIDVDIPIIDIKMPDNIKLSANEILLLENFLNFI